MMRIPSMDEIWEVSEARGVNSEAPHLWNGLVCAWPMLLGRGGKVFDVSGYLHHATANNFNHSVAWVQTSKGLSLKGDGVDDYVIADADYELLRFTYDHTLLWYGIPAYNPDFLFKEYVCIAKGSGYGSGIVEFASSFQHAFHLFYRPLGGSQSVVAGVITDPFILHCVIGRYSAFNSVELYINGVLQNSASVTTAFDNNSGTRFTMYNYSNLSRPYAPLTATQVAMWSRALSPLEIREVSSDPWAMYRVRPRVLVRGVTLKKTPIHHLMAGCV
jgi:hypothetical protein